jgi:hypothetical protein
LDEAAEALVSLRRQVRVLRRRFCVLRPRIGLLSPSQLAQVTIANLYPSPPSVMEFTKVARQQ